MRIRTLEYEGQPLRVVEKGGKFYWVVKDFAAILGFSEPHNASRKIPKIRLIIPTPGGKQPVTTVDKDGLYQILLRGRREGLKEFKDWVNFEAMGQLTKEAVNQ